MKKTTFIFMFLAIVAYAFAGNGRGPIGIKLEINGTEDMYRIGNENNWDDGLCDDINGKTEFTAISFGTPTSLKITGGAAVTWINGGEFYLSETGYALQYRVYPVSEGEKSYESSDDGWETILLNENWQTSGDHFRGENFNVDIDILSNIQNVGEYYFDVRFRAINYYNDQGPWSNYHFNSRNTFTVTDDKPIASFNSFTVGLENAPLQFTNSSSNATSYSWNFGDGNISTEENPVHTFAAPGTYTVTLTATNDAGNRAATKTILIMEQSAVSNLLVGSGMTDASKWVIAEQGKSQPSFTWNSSDAPTGATTALRFTKSGNDGFVLYQPVYLTAEKTYTFDCLVKDLGGNASSTWMQIFFSNTIQPNDNEDITDLGIVEGNTIGQLSSWRSGHEPAGIDDSFAANAGVDDYTGNICEFTPSETGMYYFIFRIGTWGGNMDIAITNLSLLDKDNIGSGLSFVDTDNIIVTGEKSSITATFAGSANVAVYSVQGILIKQAVAENTYTINGLPTGLYIVKINDKACKVIVK